MNTVNTFVIPWIKRNFFFLWTSDRMSFLTRCPKVQQLLYLPKMGDQYCFGNWPSGFCWEDQRDIFLLGTLFRCPQRSCTGRGHAEWSMWVCQSNQSPSYSWKSWCCLLLFASERANAPRWITGLGVSLRGIWFKSITLTSWWNLVKHLPKWPHYLDGPG